MTEARSRWANLGCLRLGARSHRFGSRHRLPRSPACADGNYEECPLRLRRGIPMAKPKKAKPQARPEKAKARTKPQKDEEREERITMEIVVDAYNEDERAMGWYCYL